MAEQVGRWGWHRLDSHWIKRLIRTADVQPDDLVLDVGAGTGAITASLLAVGAKVIAVELHPGRAAVLRKRFAGDRVVVVRTDAADLRLPRRPFKVVANLPFGVTTSVLRRITAPRSALELASLVVPTWAGARWAAGRGAGGLSPRRRFNFSSGPVPAAAFKPPPPRDAAVLIIRRCEPFRPGRPAP